MQCLNGVIFKIINSETCLHTSFALLILEIYPLPGIGDIKEKS